MKARLRCRLKSAAENTIRRGHPWIFSESIAEQNREGTMGELAVIYDRRDQFLAIGLFDPDSSLRIRVLHVGKPAVIDHAWWRASLEAALAKRAGILDRTPPRAGLSMAKAIAGPDSCWINTRHALVLKLYTAAWLSRVDELSELCANV